MLARTLRVTIHAEHETIWKILLDMLRSPEQYAPEMKEVQLFEESGDVLVRSMKLHDATVREKVAIDAAKSEIRHEILQHPNFIGSIVTRVVRTARQSPVSPNDLEYEFELQPKSFHTEGIVEGEARVLKDLEVEMYRIKERSEERESLVEDRRGGNPDGT